MPFVELARGMVFLVRVKLQSLGMECLGQEHEACSPPLAPLRRIDIHPVDAGAGHREKGNNLLVARTHPDVAARANHLSKNVAGSFQREPLPGGKVRVGRSPRTVPHANDGGLILVLD